MSAGESPRLGGAVPRETYSAYRLSCPLQLPSPEAGQSPQCSIATGALGPRRLAKSRVHKIGSARRLRLRGLPRTPKHATRRSLALPWTTFGRTGWTLQHDPKPHLQGLSPFPLTSPYARACDADIARTPDDP